MSWHPYTGRYENMQYRYCGKSGLRLPALSLGLWHSFGHVQPLDSQRALLRKAFDLGITHFDLANNYGPPPGSAEENFGRLLREDFAGYRDELIISTKAGYDMWPGPYGSGGSRKYLLASLDQSLNRMGVEYVDIFYSHRVDENTPMEETAAALAQGLLTGKYLNGIPDGSRMQREGKKVRGLTEKMLTEANLSSLRLLNEMAHARGQTMAQMALSWLLKDERVTSVLIGASRPEQLEENVQALNNLRFSEDELMRIDQHVADGELNLWQASSDK
ncbi:aldo/keto reductase [Enterobacter hormaechei]|uniref:aldo/keto reductase n=1 Tax=Enterobacter hormaechei TaxID=158836 RepID=UPI001260E339|nr:aldo/keto reductase [Enterobacter hormaechei]